MVLRYGALYSASRTFLERRHGRVSELEEEEMGFMMRKIDQGYFFLDWDYFSGTREMFFHGFYFIDDANFPKHFLFANFA